MSGTVRAILAEAVGLFVDDGSLALAATAWVAATALAVHLLGLAPAAGAVLLFLGIAGILAENVRRSARRLGAGHP